MTDSIRGVEIFAEGRHNGDAYSEKDLDALVTNFEQLKEDFTPALKVGHTRDAPGAPAYGWVKNLRRIGKKLYADFTDLHQSVVNAIRSRAYDRCSCEIYGNLERNGKVYSLVLKAVALLGAEIPAVANLTPLHQIQFSGGRFARIVTSAEVSLPSSRGEAVHAAVQARILRTGEAYSDALTAVLRDNPALARSYSADLGLPEEHPHRDDDEPNPRATAGIAIDGKVRAILEADPQLRYSDALHKVLERNPGLAERYRGVADPHLG